MMKTHVFGLALTCFVTLCAAAGINFFIDSRNNFALSGEAGAHLIERYVSKLRESAPGLVMIEQDRLVKAELARQSSDDCYVIGSSHLFQFDATTTPRVFHGCRSVVNLAVSAGGFEDLVTFAGILAAREEHLGFFFEIAPWSLRPNPAPLWTEYEDVYDHGRTVFALNQRPFEFSTFLGEWGALFRADYVIMNLKFLEEHGLRNGSEGAARIVGGVPAREASDDEVVFLPDGRISYPAAVLRSAPPDPALIGDGGFNMADPALDPTTVSELERVIAFLLRRGHKVTFVMTPYNPLVMACRTPSVCRTLQTVESFARQASLRWNVPLIGSFDPRPFGLTQQDFMDDMHLLLSGLFKFDASFARLIAKANRQ